VQELNAHVVRISVAPVKSLALVHPDEVLLEHGGVAGDRQFWLLDERGRLFNGKRDGRVHQVRPDWDESSRRLSLAFPGGERVEGVVELGEELLPELYGEPLRSRVVRGPWADALSRFLERPLRLLWAEGGAVDRRFGGGVVSLVSRGSLERLREEAGVEASVDGRRFRMLLEIDGVAPHQEDAWLGRKVDVGEATVAVNGDVGRCVVTSRHPDSGVVDLPTLETLVRYRREGVSEPLPFGVYGSVATPGRIRVGDAVRARERGSRTERA
jgi:uncharacterized protein YcbX